MPAKQQHARKGGGKFLPAFCNVCGVLMLLAVFLLCLPLVVPGLMGYQSYNVSSASMEPAVPVGSAMYVETVDPSYLQEGDVIAYHDGESVAAHRVVTNRSTIEELVIKGDANEKEDFDPLPYDAVVGRVAFSVPTLGTFTAVLTTPIGLIYLVLAAACGVMLNMLASQMRALRRPVAPGLKPKRRSIWQPVAASFLLAVFVGSAGVVGYTMYQHYVSDTIYHDASDRFTKEGGPVAPITVDFKSLRAKNPDIVGWIYCPDTPINYPVLQGKDNDQYLYTDYTGAYNIDGSIFVDADNTPGFMDSNTIIYGHHMASGSMFAGLERWADQAYYEEHLVVWLLTPEQNYQVVLFSGHHIDAGSSMYDIIKRPGPEMNAFLSEALEKSDFKETSGMKLDPYARYVMLSTCAYLFDGDRYVLHGQLVPAR